MCMNGSDCFLFPAMYSSMSMTGEVLEGLNAVTEECDSRMHGSD